MLGIDVGITRVAASHHISIGKDGKSLLPSAQNLAQFLYVKSANGDVCQVFEIIPGLNTIEHFEYKNSQQDILWGIFVYILVDNITDKVLTHTVAGSIYIGKLILLKDGVIRQMSLIFATPPEDIHPLLDKIEIVFQGSIVRNNAICLLNPHRYPIWGGCILSNCMDHHVCLHHRFRQAKLQMH